MPLLLGRRISAFGLAINGWPGDQVGLSGKNVLVEGQHRIGLGEEKIQVSVKSKMDGGRKGATHWVVVVEVVQMEAPI